MNVVDPGITRPSENQNAVVALKRRQSATLTVAIGMIVTVDGVPMRLENVNAGKRRLTFTPVVPGKLALCAKRDPVVGVLS